MPKVRFHPLRLEAETYECETLLDAARRIRAPLGASCGAVGVCGRCRVTVLDGAEALLPPTTIELRTSEERNLGPAERLACQSVVTGDCTVTTDYWG
jgi:ferredoxin